MPQARRLHTRRAASRTADGYAAGSKRLHAMSVSGFQRNPLAWRYSSRSVGFSDAKRSGKRRSTKRFSCAWYPRSSRSLVSDMPSLPFYPPR